MGKTAALAGGGIYCGTKSYIDAFTEAIRHDFVNSQVKVTAVSPGAVQTEFSNVRYKGDDTAANATYEGMQPLLASDIADQVLFAATRCFSLTISSANKVSRAGCLVLPMSA